MAPAPFLEWVSCRLPLPGFLPNWVLLYALLSMAIGFLAYIFPKPAARTYLEPDILSVSRVTPVAVRAVGAYMILSSLVRINAATNPTDVSAVNGALLTYAAELVYLLSECFVYRSVWFSARFVVLTLLTGMTLIWLRSMQPYSVRFDMYRWETACRGYEGSREEYRRFGAPR